MAELTRRDLFALPLLAPLVRLSSIPLVPCEWMTDMEPGDLYPNYRRCDFCHLAVCDDIDDGKPWRQFFKATDGSGLSVCQHCTGAFVRELPEPVKA